MLLLEIGYQLRRKWIPLLEIRLTSTARTVIHLIVFIGKNFVHFDALLL